MFQWLRRISLVKFIIEGHWILENSRIYIDKVFYLS